MLTLELDGPQPRALALLARLADHHGLVLVDLHAHRVLGPEDASVAFGQAMIPVPAGLPIPERRGRCLALFLCSEELGMILPDLLDCSRPLDPLGPSWWSRTSSGGSAVCSRTSASRTSRSCAVGSRSCDGCSRS